MANNRKQLLSQLQHYKPYDTHEAQMQAKTIAFIKKHKDCFLRSNLSGHLTGSAWVLDYTNQFTLLTHHLKLDKWLQLGGHADGVEDMLAVALKEAHQESGLRSLEPINPNIIFDIDTHIIPACNETPEHIHFDIRFLLRADRFESLVQNSESKALAWVHLWDVGKFNQERSMMRMVKKTIERIKY